jgi:hypothetical protein
MTVAGYATVASAALADSDAAPSIPGFVASDFGPLVRAVAHRCLGEPPAAGLLGGRGDRVGIVLSSAGFDTASLERSAGQVAGGRLVDALLFHQTVPNSVLGVLACDYGLTGPMNCVAALTDPRAEALAVACLLLADGAADTVLAVAVDLPSAGTPRRATADLIRRGSQE